MKQTPEEVLSMLQAIAYPMKLNRPATAELLLLTICTINQLLEDNTELADDNSILRRRVSRLEEYIWDEPTTPEMKI